MPIFIMGDLMLKCPLCCNKTFDSKISLTVHLVNVLSNLTCPVCENKWSSLAHLIEHLNLDECQPEYIIETLEEDIDETIDDTASQKTKCENENLNCNEYEMPTLSDGSQIEKELSEDTLNDDSTYIGSLDDKSKICSETQGLKLVFEEGGMKQYVFMDQDGSQLGLQSTVVTKQNNDGTISLTTIKDMKEKSETEMNPPESEVGDSEGLYICNTCGISFTSVIEHIQTYHSDQEVVVEEPLEEDDNGLIEPVQYDSLPSEDFAEKQEAPRRVITDTGDIVDAAMIMNSNESNEIIVPTALKDMPKAEKQNRPQSKRFVQIDEFCDSMVKNIKGEVDEKDGPYHKVIMKEVQTLGGNKIKSYYCMSCHIYVTNLKDFKLHPCKTLKYPCPHCPVAYENSKSLCGHMKVHKQAPKLKPDEVITNGPVTYECGICNTIFLTNKSLKLHKRMHDPIKSRPIEPPVENSDGTEGSTDKYKCNICDKMIPMDYRTIHQNSHNSNELNCAICNRKFHSSEYLEMHMNVHNLDKVQENKPYKSLPYNCLYCTRRFARPHEKVKHERIHTGEKPHSCEICGKSFRVSYCLTLHMRTHTGARPYCCKHCGKRFKAHSVYNHHLLTHSEVRAYKCPYCPKAFKTSVQLAGHKNSHTKPFSCQHCNRPFASLYAVRVHTETHLRQNNLKFACTLCGASYARAFALKDHVRQAHHQDINTNDLPMGTVLKVKDEWAMKQNAVETETDAQSLNNKDLSEEITELELSTNELVIP